MLSLAFSFIRLPGVCFPARLNSPTRQLCNLSFSTGLALSRSSLSPRTSFVHMAPRTRGKGAGSGAVASPNSRVIVAQSRGTKSVKVVPMSEVDREAMIRKGAMIRAKLEELYPETPRGFLTHRDSYSLLISVLLSAQSLDAIVNQVTPELFREADTPEKMILLGEDRIRSIIKPVGLSPQKSKNIVALSKMLVEQHGSQVPASMELMEKLPGVGHKTAGVVAMSAFGIEAFPVDTHIHRLACRWGCGNPKSVPKTEENLKKWFPEGSSWRALHLRMIQFGREYCPAMRHDMDKCPICVFAATDEARAANAASPKKFVGALTHENPYVIREIASLGTEMVEVTEKRTGSKAVKKSTTGGRSTGKKMAKSMLSTDETDMSGRKPVSGRKAKSKAKALLKEVDEEESDEYDDDVRDKKRKNARVLGVSRIERKRKHERIQDEDYRMKESDIFGDDEDSGEGSMIGEVNREQKKRKKSKLNKKSVEDGLVGRSIKLRLPVRKPGKRGKAFVSAQEVEIVDVTVEDAIRPEGTNELK